MSEIVWFLGVAVIGFIGYWVGYGNGYDRGMTERDRTWDEMYEQVRRSRHP